MNATDKIKIYGDFGSTGREGEFANALELEEFVVYDHLVIRPFGFPRRRSHCEGSRRITARTLHQRSIFQRQQVEDFFVYEEEGCGENEQWAMSSGDKGTMGHPFISRLEHIQKAYRMMQILARKLCPSSTEYILDFQRQKMYFLGNLDKDVRRSVYPPGIPRKQNIHSEGHHQIGHIQMCKRNHLVLNSIFRRTDLSYILYFSDNF